MASFLHKLNRMRTIRMHMANEYLSPTPGLYHEIIQGIPWYGGISMTKPKRLDAGVDRVLTYVIEKRPEYKNFPWCAGDNRGVYTHPATYASDRICHLMDLSATLTLPEAFEIVDKEMNQKKAEVDLQVSLAREHAAKLGVVNQGVESLIKRAHRVYDSVFKMKEEEAVKTRRNLLRDVCKHLQRRGDRLHLQDIIDVLPYRDEQVQFFMDFPEYRKLFPPLWWLSNEVADYQAGATLKQEAGEIEATSEEGEEGENDEGNELQEVEQEGEAQAEAGVDFLEDDPRADALKDWPPQALFDRQARNKIKVANKKNATEDAELVRARAEAKSIIEGEEEAEVDEFDQILQIRAMQDARKHRQSTLEQERPEFYNAYRQFLVDNSHLPAKERGKFVDYAKEELPDSANESYPPISQLITDEQEVVIKHVTEGGEMDLESMRKLRNAVRDRQGDQAAMDVFEYADGGGAVSLAQLEGLSPYDPKEERHVNLTANLDLSPFYPENAFPPRGLLADPNVDLTDPNNLPEQYQGQYQELVRYGAKYAHAIEDHAPVKSKVYVEESIQNSTPIVMEYTPEKSEVDVNTRAANLADVIAKQKASDYTSLEEYESKLGAEETKSEEETKKEDNTPSVSEAQLQSMKKVALDELAKIAFESDAERKEYEQMLERRFDYIAQKRKERNQQWAQYWPSDKPETLIYRGPDVIREIFPEAYKLAVTRKFEELSGLPINQAVGIKSYTGLWKSVRARENREQGKEGKSVADLDMSEWQHQVSLDPTMHR